MNKKKFNNIVNDIKKALADKKFNKFSKLNFFNKSKKHIIILFNDIKICKVHLCKFKNYNINYKRKKWEKYKEYLVNKIINVILNYRIKVIYLVNSILSLSLCGYTIRTNELSICINNKNVDIHVVSKIKYSTNDDIEKQVIDNISNYIMNYDNKIKIYSKSSIYSKEYEELYENKFYELCIKIQPDIIHCASDYINPLIAIRVGKKLSIPVIYEVRGLWNLSRLSYDPQFEKTEAFKTYQNLELYCYKNCNHIFALNDEIKKYIINQDINKKKITVINNGVDCDKWTPCKVSNLTSLDAKTKVIFKQKTNNCIIFGYIGSIVEYEGLDILIRAANLLIKKNIKLKLLIIGGGTLRNIKNYQESLLNLIKKLHLEEHVIILGQKDNSEIKYYYSIIDVICLPRLNKKVCEIVTPLKIFEAMSMEKAIIASNVKPLKKLINKDIGLIHIKNNFVDLSNKMKFFIDNPDKIPIFGKNAREYVKNNFTWNMIVNEIIKIYNILIE